MPAERSRAPGSGAAASRLRSIATRAAAVLGIVGAIVASPAAASPAVAAPIAAAPAAAAPAVTAAPTPTGTAAGDATNPFDGITVAVADSLFLADRSTVRVVVTNKHTYQIRVPVTAWANSPRLDIDGAPVFIQVAPQTQGVAEFPAVAVSNGIVTVSAGIVDRSGSVTPATVSTATFNIQAGWETPLVLVIGGLILALAIVGVIRTVRRVRRTRRESADASG